MEDQETISPEYEEIKKEYVININNNNLIIEINNDEIIFTLIIGISYYKYIKKYKYDEIIKELNMFECKNIEEVYICLVNSEYKIINEEKIKKIIINNKEINLNKKIIKNQELLKILINEINKQNEKIDELAKKNEEKDNKINNLEYKYTKLKELIYEIDDNIKDKYKDEINLIYETEEEGDYNIFGEKFVEINKDNIELNINVNKS